MASILTSTDAHAVAATGGRYPAAVEAEHVRACADRIAEPGGVSALTRWCRDQGWGAVHTKSVIEKARRLFAAEHAETMEDSRGRLKAWLEYEIQDAQDTILGVSKAGKPIRGKDRRALASFGNMLLTLGGLNQSTVHHVHDGARPLREMTTAELLAEEQRIAQAIQDKLPEAEVLTRSEESLPSEEKTLPSWVNECYRIGAEFRGTPWSYLACFSCDELESHGDPYP